MKTKNWRKNCMIFWPKIYISFKIFDFNLEHARWGCNSVVECPLRMRKVPGSIPGTSTKIFFMIEKGSFFEFALFFSTFSIVFDFGVILFFHLTGKGFKHLSVSPTLTQISPLSTSELSNVCWRHNSQWNESGFLRH